MNLSYVDSFVLILFISISEDKNDSVSPLELDPDVLKILCKIVNSEKKGTDEFKRDIYDSEFHEKYANYCLKPNTEPMSITGYWRKDLGIQTAADVFQIKIYVVVPMGPDKRGTYCFAPKNSDRDIWMKIEFEKENQNKILSGRGCRTLKRYD